MSPPSRGGQTTRRSDYVELPPKGGPAYRPSEHEPASPCPSPDFDKMEVWSLTADRVAGGKSADVSAWGGRACCRLESCLAWPAPTNVSYDRKAERGQANDPGAPKRSAWSFHHVCDGGYVLTKDVRERDSGRPAMIVVKLNETGPHAHSRESRDCTGYADLAWYGGWYRCAATIMWWPGVAMAGIIRTMGAGPGKRLRGGVRTVAVVETARIACHRTTCRHCRVSE